MPEKSPRRVVLYVRSVEVPSGGPGRVLFHCDACERHRVDVDKLKTPAHLAGRVFPDADWKAISFVQRLQDEKSCEVEIVDLAKGLWRRMKLRRQGIGKTPQFVVDGQLLPSITSFEQLAEFLATGIISSESSLRGVRRRQKRDKDLAETMDSSGSSAVRS